MEAAEGAYMMTVVPEGGLCNRMRAVASAVRLAQINGQTLRVQWHSTPDLNCRLGDLFDTSDLPLTVDERNAMGVLNVVAKMAWRVREWVLPMLGVAVSGPRETALFLEHPELREAKSRARHWHLRTHSKLLDGPGMLAALRPVPALQAVIDTYAARLQQSVGVHIRRSDNLQATQHSPLEAFIDLMRAEKRQHPDLSFYVATDSPETYAQLKQEFGDAVFTHPKASVKRDDPQAIRDAVVDLFALSACQRLIGSYWSSFTDTAWELRGIPHLIVKAA